MNLNKYTEKAQEAVLGAQQLAERTNNPQIEPEHLLYTLIDQRGGVVPDVLRKMNIEPANVLVSVQQELPGCPRCRAAPSPIPRRACARSPTPRKKKRRGCRTSTSAPSTCSSPSPRRADARPRRGCWRSSARPAIASCRHWPRCAARSVSPIRIRKAKYQALERYGATSPSWRATTSSIR